MRRLSGLTTTATLALVFVTGLPANATNPGKNGRIVFGADRGSGFEVYIDRPDGTGLTRLTNVNGTDNPSPDWSPDGTLIAFALVREGCSVNVMHADGTGLSDLTGDRKGCERYPGVHGERPASVVQRPTLRTLSDRDRHDEPRWRRPSPDHLLAPCAGQRPRCPRRSGDVTG
jgi:WD40 repeat protein